MSTEKENNHTSPPQKPAETLPASTEENNPVQAANAPAGEFPLAAINNNDEIKKVVTFRDRAQTYGPVTVSPAPELPSPQQTGVQVTPNLLNLISGLSTTAEEQQAVQKQRDLNEIIHRMLIIGLTISTILMLTGLGLDLALGREMPTVVPDFAETFRRVAALRPSGFLTLGMLVLIATPILRVVGTIAAFIYERDWRYAGVTVLVLLIVIISLISGKG